MPQYRRGRYNSRATKALLGCLNNGASFLSLSAKAPFVCFGQVRCQSVSWRKQESVKAVTSVRLLEERCPHQQRAAFGFCNEGERGQELCCPWRRLIDWLDFVAPVKSKTEEGLVRVGLRVHHVR